MLPLQRSDFAGILAAMDDLPVTVRLLDPPLHEFLPDLTELSVRVAVAEVRGTTVPHDARLLAAVRRLHEQNPMLGLRGVRLGLVVPGLFAMQARALLHAVADRLDSGGSPAVEIMVPLVASHRELELVRAELEVESALAKSAGTTLEHERSRVFDAVHRMHEQNPMLGLRGVRLGLVIEGLYEMQVRALAEAAAELAKAGKNPRAEVMIPLTAGVQELEIMNERVGQVVDQVSEAYGVQLHVPVGTMIEVPRAALTAGEIAPQADFFSFGTNDLTQMTWAFSRDDVEGAFFGRYIELGIFAVSPFESLDTQGVGQLVRMATQAGKAANPALEVGVCGEHGGDPSSIHFFDTAGVDYVSCSPFRVPVARLEAGRASVAASGADGR
jgi:pyruvate,orthophosphate dikinase